MPHLLHEFASEADLVKAVGELSQAFTTDRANIQRYLSDPRLVSAYAAFYLATNVPKLTAVMQWLTPEFREQLKGFELIDVGAGPGTFTLAWKQLTGGGAVMLETSLLMRQQAEKLLSGLHGEKARFSLPPKDKPRLLLFGHSLNEMGCAAGLAYVEEAQPELVWLIEPGTKEVFKLVLQFRQEMLARGWHIRYPCLGEGECPMTQGEDWCHQYVDVRHEVDVERLTQLAHRDRRRLPLSVFMFERAPITGRVGELARIVRTFPATKFSHEWQVCHPQDGALTLQRFQLPFKSYPREWRRDVEALSAGHLIGYQVEKWLPGGVRVRLVKDETSK